MTEYVCPGCQDVGMAKECWHDPKTWELAQAMAVGLPGGPAEWGTPVKRAYAFIDDAESLIGSVGEPPYTVTMFHPEGHSSNYTVIGLVNGRYLFAVDEEADFIGDCGSRLTIAAADDENRRPTCPEWLCPDLSSEDLREGKHCPDHPCTCTDDEIRRRP